MILFVAARPGFSRSRGPIGSSSIRGPAGLVRIARRVHRMVPMSDIEDLIGDLKDNYTIVIVTHNMQEAARVSDTTAFFNINGAGEPGKLVEVGSTEKIFTKPDDPRTEDYITGRFG